MASESDQHSIFIDQRIDQLCDRFEAEWSSGQVAELEIWLASNLESALAALPFRSPVIEQRFRQRLTEELVQLEIAFRRHRGQHSSAQEYSRRFPDLEQANIEAWIAQRPAPQDDSVTRGMASTEAETDLREIGRFKIIEKIGQGGMGVVYRAQQHSPIRREVAIKLIKLGMDTRNVIARFDAERQALAMMDHPHIAKVYEASADSSDRPYFVMEYVRGKPITDYADQQQLNIFERLNLFQQVCRAIQHAHLKGIIHRDIKPSNILTFTQDGSPCVKVIDFGIAKAVSQPLTDKTLFTLHSQFLGTPQYMSPEQAEGNLDIDTRSDVYSLGVLLYELLTGSTPFSLSDLKSAKIEQVRQIICEVEPPKPSTRLSTTEPSLATLAARRRTEPVKLGSIVRGELDWIAMMAIEKDRRRRYESPGKLAEDIANFLEGRPVIAAPPSRFYQFQKTVIKHRWSLSISAAFLSLLVTASVVSWLQTARTVKALEAEKTQRQIAEDFEKKATRALQDSQHNLYYSTVALAHREFLANSVDGALKRLDEAPAELRGWEWGYVKRLCQSHLKQWSLSDLHFHSASALAAHPRSPLIAIGGLGGVVTINIDDGTITNYETTQADVQELKFSPDGKSLAVGTSDWTEQTQTFEINQYQVYDLDSGQLQQSQIADSVSALDFLANDTLIYADQRHLFTRQSQQQVVLAKCDDAEGWNIDSLLCNPQRTHFAYSQGDATVQIRSVAPGQLHQELTIPDGNVTAFVFSPDGQRLAVSCTDGTVRIWDVSNGQTLLTFNGHPNGAAALAFSPDGKSLASGGFDQRIAIWDSITGKIKRTLNGHPSNIVGVAFLADGRLVSCDASDKVLVWDPTANQEALTLHHSMANFVAYLRDGQQLVTFGDDQNVTIWQASSGARVRQFEVGEAEMEGLAVNADDNILVMGEAIQIWSPESGEKLFEIPINGAPITSIPMRSSQARFHPNGSTLAIDFDTALALFNLEDRDAPRVLSNPELLENGEVERGLVDFSSDGKLLVSHGVNHRLKIWETSSGQVLKELVGHTESVVQALFHPSSRWIASAGSDKQVRIWDLATGTTIATLEGHGGAILCLAFSPDGKRLVSAGEDMTIRLWDTASWRPVITLTGHTLPILQVAFSPDGKTLASASVDGTVRLWESAEKTEKIEREREAARRARIIAGEAEPAKLSL